MYWRRVYSLYIILVFFYEEIGYGNGLVIIIFDCFVVEWVFGMVY